MNSEDLMRFSWRRFWASPSGRIVLDASGFLEDPDGPYGSALNPETRSFAEIEATDCLVLLGEPGIGKTSALVEERARIEQRLGPDELKAIDLKDYGSEDRLWRDVFESEWWSAWRVGDRQLHLFLDSLDEGLLRITTLARLISGGLARGRLDRLKVRIACRTADWPNSLMDQLTRLFGQDRVGIYELAPLRRVDVEAAASAMDIDSDTFLREVTRLRVGPLAAKPLTLKFLLNSFLRSGGALPSSQLELYDEGCLLLCNEPDEERRERERSDRFLTNLLPGRQRLAVASRIAAAMLLSNRSAISQMDRSDLETVTPLTELIGGTENGVVEELFVDEQAVAQALGSGLFTSRGPGLMGWAHQTYAEFLCARYLRDTSIVQIKSLVGCDDSTQVVPQLREMVTWLMSMRPDVLQWVVSIEPELPLRSDLSRTPDQVREGIVAAFIDRVAKGEAHDSGDLRSGYQRLSHPGLAVQLQPIIEGRSWGIAPRRVAIDIAEACDLTELQNTLLRIAVDITELHPVRVQAAEAVRHIGSDVTLRALSPLCFAGDGDPDDDLRGIALRALWPARLSTEDLVRAIRAPRREFYVGHYEMFLDELPERMRDEDLPTLLQAASAWPGERSGKSGLVDLLNRLVLRAWTALETPGVATALAQLVAERIRRHHEALGMDRENSLSEAIRSEPMRRRRLLEAILEETSIELDECTYLAVGPGSLLREDDVLWMLSELRRTAVRRQPLWARCISMAARGSSSSAVIDGILTARPDVPALATEFQWLRAYDLESEEAEASRAAYAAQAERRREAEQPLVDPPPAVRIRTSLVEVERGNISQWIQLTKDFELTPRSRYYHLELLKSPKEAPGWTEADVDTRQRIIGAARQYLSLMIPDGPEWVGTSSIPYSIYAGNRAWRLLMEVEDGLEGFTTEVWRRWVPALVAFPGVGHDWHTRLVCLAVRNAPTESLQSLRTVLEKDDASHGDVFLVSELGGCLSPALIGLLLEQMNRPELKPGSLFSVSKLVLSKGIQTAITTLQAVSENAGSARDNRVAATAALLLYAPDAAWSIFWRITTADPELGDAVVIRLARERFSEEGILLFTQLAEERLASLYRLLRQRFPINPDTPTLGVHWASEAEMIDDLGRRIIGALVNKATKEACTVLRQLIADIPEHRDYLRWRLREAEVGRRRAQWAPPP